MPLRPPPIDDRGYSELLGESLARIPVHTPEWTNFSEGDPGVTLLELFAFMTDSLLYRARLIPDRNRLKFLQLLGVTPRPAAPARGAVTIANERGPRDVLTLASGLTVNAGKIPFVTSTALDVLPVEAKVYLRREITEASAVARAREIYDALYGAIQDDAGSTLQFYETVTFESPAGGASLGGVNIAQTTVDRAIWVALLLRPGDEQDRQAVLERIAGKMLTIGVMPSTAATSLTLPPEGTDAATPPPRLRFDITTGRTIGATAEFAALDARADADPFTALTLVQVELPAAARIGAPTDLDPLEEGTGDLPPVLDDEKIEGRLLAWVRIRLPEPSAGDSESAASAAWRASMSWVGINAARITQRVDVRAERVGLGSGEPDQSFHLVNTPVLPETVRVSVDSEPWRRVDDLTASASEVPSMAASGWPGTGLTTGTDLVGPDATDPRVFSVDAESGELRFGDGLRGKRPPASALIVASYAYGGGRAGNVGVDAIRTAPLLPPGFTVTNPLPTWGGDDGESPADAERHIARWLRHRDRAVAAEDFADIVRRTPGVAIGRVDVLPLFHPEAGSPSPGVVTLMLVPDDPSSTAPVPDRLFLAAVCEYLEPRRLLTTEIVLTAPTYSGISVSVGIDVVAGGEMQPVRDAVAAAIRTFLSPLTGGLVHTGWPLEKAVEERELWAQGARVDGVASVRGVRLWNASGGRIDRLAISGLELPQLLRVTVSIGDPEDIIEPPTTGRRVPVPVAPVSC